MNFRFLFLLLQSQCKIVGLNMFCLSLQDKLERYGPVSTLVRQTLDLFFDTLFCARLVLLDSGLDEIVVII